MRHDRGCLLQNEFRFRYGQIGSNRSIHPQSLIPTASPLVWGETRTLWLAGWHVVGSHVHAELLQADSPARNPRVDLAR